MHDAFGPAASRSPVSLHEAVALVATMRHALERHDFADVAAVVLDECMAALGAQDGFISELTEDGAESHALQVRSSEECSVDPSLPSPLRGLRGHVVRTRRGIYDNDYGSCVHARLLPPGHQPLGAVLLVPFFVGGAVAGLMGLSGKPGGFEDDDLAIAESFAEVASHSLENWRAMRRLAASEKRFRLLFDGSRDAVFWADRSNGIILDCNRAASDLLGRSRLDIIGSHQSTVHPPEMEHEFRAMFAREAQYQGAPHDALVIRADGTHVPVEIMTSMVTIDGQDVIQGVFRDVTERLRTERRYSALFEEMLDAFALHEIILDDQGVPVDYRFLAVNPSFERMTGLAAQDVVGRSVLEIMPDTEQKWIDTYGRVVLTGDPVQFEDYSGALEKHFLVKAFRASEGRFGVTFVDITERKRAEQELERYRQRLSQLTSELLVSGERERRRVVVDLHDGVGQILVAAKMAASRIPQFQPPGEPLEEADRLLSLIDHALHEVRSISYDVSPPLLYELGLAPALTWLADRYREQFGLDAHVLVDERVGTEKGVTAILVYRVTRELLNNVHRHAGVDSADVRVVIEGADLVLTVIDAGGGFDASRVLTTEVDGAHFGLLSIYEEVTLAGGSVRIESAAGAGTRIDVRVPQSKGGGQSWVIPNPDPSPLDA